MRFVVVGVLLVLMVLLAAGCDNDDSGPSGPWVAPASSLCEKAAACEGVQPSGSEMNMCIDMMKPAFGLVPDAAGFESCVSALSCDELSSDSSNAVEDCLDLDTDNIGCLGEDALHVCTNAGKCKNIACADACAVMDGTPAGCGTGDEGWDNCLCYR